MLHEKRLLTDDGRVYLTTYIHNHSPQDYDEHGVWQPEKRPAVVIFPGGAYSFLSDREAEPVALPFLNAGFQVFVLYYSLNEHSRSPGPLEDASRALAYIREHADEFRVRDDSIAVLGFSAGGHLATWIATQWNTPGLAERLGIPDGSNRPNALVSCYGLTTREMPPWSEHSDPVAAAPDTEWGQVMREWPAEASTVNYVGDHTPPAFLWATYEDTLVPVENTLGFAQSCRRSGVPFEMHIFQTGAHGLALNADPTAYGFPHSNHPNVDQWVPLCIAWMKKLFSF